MHVKRRRLPNFEACSVALFTSLALGGAALPARAQTHSTPSITSTTSTVPSPRNNNNNKDGSISSAEFDEALK